MKKIKILSALCTLSLLSLTLNSCRFQAESNNPSSNNLIVKYEYADTLDDYIVNPDMGFYRSYKIGIDTDGELMYDGDSDALKKPANNFVSKYKAEDAGKYVPSNLVHLMVDLHDYTANGKKLWDAYEKASSKSNKKVIYETYNKLNDKDYKDYIEGSKYTLKLDAVKDTLDLLRSKNKTAIIRFHYDPKARGLNYPITLNTISKQEDESHKKDTTMYYNVEPQDLNAILQHIEQICALLKDYTDVITAVECGMLGPWGEMHGTTFGKGYMTEDEFKKAAGISNLNTSKLITSVNEYQPLSDSTSEYTHKEVELKNRIEKAHSFIIINKYLKELEKNNIKAPLLVRYPKAIYGYTTAYEGIDLLKDWSNLQSDVPTSLYDSSLITKLGMYNDGYLGSKSDTGTFKMLNASPSRNIETKFLEPFLRHTGYGGELITDDGKEYYKGGTTQAAGDEMKIVHLSFLNISHKGDALEDLDKVENNNPKYTYTYDNGSKTPLFRHILYNMGYKYYISGSSIEENNRKLTINLSVKNAGFAEMPYHRQKGYKIYLIEKDTEPTGSETPIGSDNQHPFKGNYTEANLTLTERPINTSVSIPENYKTGEYDVYLKICNIDSDSSKDGKYPIRLANKGIWNEDLEANKIGSITIK